MTCKVCGGDMVGDGYTSVLHCENVDVIGGGYEPDSGPIECADCSNCVDEGCPNYNKNGMCIDHISRYNYRGSNNE